MKGISTLAFHLLGGELVTGQMVVTDGVNTSQWVQANHLGSSYTINALVNNSDGTTEPMNGSPSWKGGRWCAGRNFVQGLLFANPYGSETAWFINVGMFCAYDDGTPSVNQIRYSDYLPSFKEFNMGITCATRPDDDEDIGITSIAFAAVDGLFGKGTITCNNEKVSYTTNHTRYNESAEIVSSMDCPENRVVIGTDFSFKKESSAGLVAVKAWCGSKIYRNKMPTLSSIYDGLLSVGDYQPSKTLAKNLTTELPLVCPNDTFLTHLDYIQSQVYNSSLWTVRLSCANGVKDSSNRQVESSVPIPQLTAVSSTSVLGSSALMLSPICSYKGASIPLKGLRQATVDVPGTDSWTGKYGMPGIEGVCIDRQSHMLYNASSGMRVDSISTWKQYACPSSHLAVGVIPVYDSTYSGQGLHALQLLCREQSSTCTPITAN